MKQKFKTMAFTLLGLVLSVNLMAATKMSTLTFTAACEGSGTADDGVAWTVTSDAAESTYDGTKGIHYGTGKISVSYLTLVTDDIDKTITKIVVNASGASKTSATISAKIGDNAFGTQEQSLTASAADYTFTGSASGTITISLNQTSATKALYVKSIEVTYDDGQGADPVLQSIAISGTPKTTYEAGEEFDITGLVVTGTYDTKDPEVITEGISWEITPSGALTVETTSVSVTATVDGKSDSKNYNVTVTEHVITPGTYEISLNNALYGISTGNNGTEQSVTQNDITVVSGCATNAGTKTYYDAAHIRYYADSYLKLSVPDGYEITSVVFTAGGTWNGSTGISVNTGSYSDTDNKTWTGKAQEVDFSMSAQCRAASIKVTFAVAKTLSSIAVKNAPTKTTYYVGDEFDPAGLVITASYTDESAEDIAYTEDNKDAFSFSGFNSEAEATDQVITVTYAEKSATFKVNIETERTLNSITVASNPDKVVYEVGEALDLTGLVVNGIFSKGDPEPVEYTADPEDGTTLDAIGTTTVTLTSVDNTELTTSFDVTVNAIEGDRLTPAAVGNKSSYAEWDNAYVGTYATYIGYGTGGDAKFQLKSSDNVAGIVSTVSGGNIAKVKVTWNSSTTSGRVLDVYGSNVAYTAASDLYDDNKKGTKIGSIKYGESTEFIVSESEYAYVGIRSASGALYLDNVTFVWSAPKVLESIAVKTAPTVVDYAAGEFFNPAGLVITATYADASFKDITYDANDTKWEFAPGLTDKLDATDDEVIISYNDIMCEDALEITVNRIASNLAAVSATKILVVDDEVNLADWYTIATNYDGKDKITFQSDDEEVFLVSGTDGLAYAAGSATLTITAPQTDTYNKEEIEIEVTVNAAAVPCSVKWMNNGEEYTVGDPSTTVNAGEKVTKLPTAPTPCEQHVFMGWTNAAIATPQADAPAVLFTDAASAPTVEAENTVYYAVYAVEGPGSDVLTKMVASNTLANGDRIVIVAHKDETMTDDVAMYQETTSTSYVNKYEFDGDINSVLADNKNWLTVNAEDGGFSLGDATNGYIYSSSNNLYCGETAQVWTLKDLEDGTFKLQSGGRNLSYRYDLEKKYWRMGGSNEGTSGQTVLDIYKIIAGGLVYSDYSTSCAPVELDKIELSGTYPTTFLLGDEFSHQGMTVTASYTNSITTKKVTSLATFSGYDANTLGEQTITVSYTEGEGESAITKTTTYNVTVNDLPNKTIAQFLANPSKCYLSGIVSNITNTTYGNYTLTDASGSAEIYGTLTPSKESKQFESLGVVAGDKIKVIANEYNTQYENIPNVIFVEKIVSPYITRTDLSNGQLITVCLDKNITSVVGGTFYQIEQGTTSEITFAEFAEEEFPIAKATPLLFQSDGSEMKVFCGTDQVADGDKETIVEHRAMKGLVNTATTLQTPIEVGNILVNGGQLRLVGANCVLTPGHAYIDVAELAQLGPLQPISAPRRTITLRNPDAAPTNLNGLNGNIKATKVLRDGQLYIIRDTKMYNAQGIEVQ